MVRTAAADELCEYCRVSLEFFSNTARWEREERGNAWGLNQYWAIQISALLETLPRQETGGRLPSPGQVEAGGQRPHRLQHEGAGGDAQHLPRLVPRLVGETDNDLMTVREWCDISNFPSSHTATFPRVRPCSQVMTSGLQQPLTIRKVEHS